MSLYFNIKYPDLFAASMFVSCQWDVAKMEGFKDKKFVYITAGGDKEATGGANQLKALLRKEGAPFAEATWSARLPEAEQDSLARALLARAMPETSSLLRATRFYRRMGRGWSTWHPSILPIASHQSATGCLSSQNKPPREGEPSGIRVFMILS